MLYATHIVMLEENLEDACQLEQIRHVVNSSNFRVLVWPYNPQQTQNLLTVNEDRSLDALEGFDDIDEFTLAIS